MSIRQLEWTVREVLDQGGQPRSKHALPVTPITLAQGTCNWELLTRPPRIWMLAGGLDGVTLRGKDSRVREADRPQSRAVHAEISRQLAQWT